MSYLVFLALGSGIIWLSRRAKDDISWITAILSGVILLVWGFVLAPLVLQIGIELIGILAVSSMSIRYYSLLAQRSR